MGQNEYMQAALTAANARIAYLQMSRDDALNHCEKQSDRIAILEATVARRGELPPMQPIELDGKGVIRFRKNAIVCALLDSSPLDMNNLARMNFSDEDRRQFAQLIGYSVSGYGDLSYVDEKSCNRADEIADRIVAELAGGGAKEAT